MSAAAAEAGGGGRTSAAASGRSAATSMADAATILERCDDLAALSSQPERLERVYLSPEHAAANELVAQWMREAALSTWQDPAGNQCGRREGNTEDLPALVLGSHIDTVPDAGRYDGMLGVLIAIQVANRLRDTPLPFALEVVAFGDEEGTRFGPSPALGMRRGGTSTTSAASPCVKRSSTSGLTRPDFRVPSVGRNRWLGTSKCTSSKGHSSRMPIAGSAS